MKALKIGGSVITNKYKNKKPDLELIKKISKEIRTGYKDLVLIHGAGSFGHPLVKKYGMENGIAKEKQKKSINKIQASVKELNKLLSQQLVNQDIPVMNIHPSSLCLAQRNSIEIFPTETIKEALKNDILPILHGDIVLDQERGTKILSGDEIISYLSQELEVDRIGMGARSPVLDNEGQKIDLINEYNPDIFKETHSTDVTGGMELKVKELLSTKTMSFIFDATKEGNVERFLNNQKIGTEVLYNEN